MSSTLNKVHVLIFLALVACDQEALKEQRFEAKQSTGKTLVVGDSISIGYTPFLENAFHCPGNARSTTNTLHKFDLLTGNFQWDTIIFNNGIHDITFIDGTIRTSLDLYKANLTELAFRYKQISKTQVFITSSFIPPTTPFGRTDENIKLYNQAAIEIMNQLNIKVIDIHDFTQNLDQYRSAPNDVHYIEAGYELISEFIKERI